MSLTVATILSGLAVLVAGGLLFGNSRTVRDACRRFPRSEEAAWVLMIVAGGWFLSHVAKLGEADFGNFRHLLMIGFGGLGVLSFWFAKEFLSVRAACILYLLVANVLLGAAYFQDPVSRLVLVGPVYVGIVLALYLAVSPFRVRDFFTWLHQESVRPRLLGGALLVYGLVLLVLPLTY